MMFVFSIILFIFVKVTTMDIGVLFTVVMCCYFIMMLILLVKE